MYDTRFETRSLRHGRHAPLSIARQNRSRRSIRVVSIAGRVRPQRVRRITGGVSLKGCFRVLCFIIIVNNSTAPSTRKPRPPARMIICLPFKRHTKLNYQRATTGKRAGRETGKGIRKVFAARAKYLIFIVVAPTPPPPRGHARASRPRERNRAAVSGYRRKRV